MDHEALDVRDVREQGEDLQIVDKLPRFLSAALDFEGEDGCAAVLEISLIQLMVGVIGERGVVDLFDQRMIRISKVSFACELNAC